MITTLALLSTASAFTVDVARPNGPVDVVAHPDSFPDVNDADAFQHRTRLVRFRTRGVSPFSQIDLSFQVVGVGGTLGTPFTTPENIVPCGDWHDGGPAADERDICWRAPLETTYRVTVSDGSTDEVVDVVVKDVWVVALGDSYSSGEGNPDVPSVRTTSWGFASYSEPVWRDDKCHRSSVAWPYQVAEDIQADNPDAQVMFTFLACSGARITKGLLDRYGGVVGSDLLPAQLDVVEDIMSTTWVDPANSPSDLGHQFGYGRAGVGQFAPDVLMMTAGGNDGGFSEIVRACITGPCAEEVDAGARLADVDVAAQELALRLDAMDVPFDRRLHLEYPDFTTTYGPYTKYNGNSVNYFDDSCFSGRGTDDSSDDQHAYRPPGGSRVAPGSRDFGFVYHELLTQAPGLFQGAGTGTYVDGPILDFLGHGVCSTDPWVLDLETSGRVQNYVDEDIDLWDYLLDAEDADHTRSLNGAYHPNAKGHEKLTDSIRWPALDAVRDSLRERRPNLGTDLFIAGASLDPATIYWHDDVYDVFADDEIQHRMFLDGVEVPMTGRLNVPGQGVRTVVVERTYEVPGLSPIPLPPLSFLVRGEDAGWNVKVVESSTGQVYDVPARDGHPSVFDAWTWVGDISLQPTSPEGPVEVTLTHVATGDVSVYVADGTSSPPLAQYTDQPGRYVASFCQQGTTRCGHAGFTVRDSHSDLRLDQWVEFRGHLNYRRTFDGLDGLDNGALAASPYNVGVLENDVFAQVDLAWDTAWAEISENWGGGYIGRFDGSQPLALRQQPDQHGFMVTACYNPLRGCIEGTGFGPGETMLLSDSFQITGDLSQPWWWWWWGLELEPSPTWPQFP